MLYLTLGALRSIYIIDHRLYYTVAIFETANAL